MADRMMLPGCSRTDQSARISSNCDLTADTWMAAMGMGLGYWARLKYNSPALGDMISGNAVHYSQGL